jgi:hypothetical protein
MEWFAHHLYSIAFLHHRQLFSLSITFLGAAETGEYYDRYAGFLNSINLYLSAQGLGKAFQVKQLWHDKGHFIHVRNHGRSHTYSFVLLIVAINILPGRQRIYFLGPFERWL